MRLLRPDRGTTGRRARHAKRRRRSRPARRPAQGVGASGHETGSRATSPVGRLRVLVERAVPVALPLQRRAAVLQQPRSLVPQATSHKENVYEYEPSGVGSCQSPTGRLRVADLLGQLGRESAFLEATPTGNDVFFLTAAQLCHRTPTRRSTSTTPGSARSESPCLTPPAPAPAGCSAANACRPAEPGAAGPRPTRGQCQRAPGRAIIAQAARGRPAVSRDRAEQAKPTRAQQLASALKACKRRYHTPRRNEPIAKRRRGRGSAKQEEGRSEQRRGRR